MKKVSIIIPAYNAEKTIEKCLDSLVNQKYKNIEIIVVDDGSTDKTSKILQRYDKNYSNVNVITKKNGGQASARNLGLEKSKGDYILFVDSDDYVSETLLLDCSKAINNGNDIILFNYYDVIGELLVEVKALKANVSGFVDVREYFLSGIVSPCNKIIKKSYLDALEFKFPEGIIYEDYAVMPTLILNNPSIVYVDKPLYYYVKTDNSTMRSQEYKKKYEDLFIATELLYKKMIKTGYLDELEYVICMHMLYHGSLNFFKYKKYDQINRISKNIKDMFPNWKKNKYLKLRSLRERVLMKLFYARHYRLIRFITFIKRIGN